LKKKEAKGVKAYQLNKRNKTCNITLLKKKEAKGVKALPIEQNEQNM
jgi:hypothetical protein